MKLIIEVPDGWKADCSVCDEYIMADCMGMAVKDFKCPLANAKEAVEVKNHLNEYGKGNYNDSFWFDPKGKPVKLFAVKGDKNG